MTYLFKCLRGNIRGSHTEIEVYREDDALTTYSRSCIGTHSSEWVERSYADLSAFGD